MKFEYMQRFNQSQQVVKQVASAVVLSFIALTCQAQNTSDMQLALAPNAETAADVKEVNSEAVLTIFNRDIINLRATVLGIDPQDRVKRAKNRIDKQLQSGETHLASMKPMPPGMLIQIDGAGAFYIAPEDIDTFQQETLQTTSQQAVDMLNVVITETHQSRNLDYMMSAVGMALLATLVFGLLVWLILWSERRIEAKIVAYAKSKLDEITSRNALSSKSKNPKISALILGRERLLWFCSHLIDVLAWLFILILSYKWLSVLMAQFPITRPWGENLNSFFVNFALMIGSAILKAIPDLFTVVVIFILAKVATRGLSRFFRRVKNKTIQLEWLDAELANPTKRIVNMCVWLFALAMAYPYLPGAQTEAFKGVSVLVGLMISLGASGLVGQVASGLILTYAGIYRRGEFIRVQDNEGTIIEMGMFTTRIKNGIGVELTIPNSLVLSNVTRNYSKSTNMLAAKQGLAQQGYIVDIHITCSYDTPWRDVRNLLIEAALRNQSVLQDPAPQVLHTGLADFNVQYTLVCQVIPATPTPRAQVIDDIYSHIQDVFNEHDIGLLSPHYMHAVLSRNTENTAQN